MAPSRWSCSGERRRPCPHPVPILSPSRPHAGGFLVGGQLEPQQAAGRVGPAASLEEPPLEWHWPPSELGMPGEKPPRGSHIVFGDVISDVTQPYPSPTRVLSVTQTDPGRV